MPADLSPEESSKLAIVMVRLHAEFRRRHGLPPWPSIWTLSERLEELKGRSALNEASVLRSPRPVIGRPVELARRFLWKLLKPLFDRQTDVNRDLIAGLEALERDRRDRRYAEVGLSVRVNELEKWQAMLRERDE
jgi:hypothetical protein